MCCFSIKEFGWHHGFSLCYDFYLHIGLSCSCKIRLIQSQYWRSVSCSISEIMGGNPAGEVKFFSRFLLGSFSTCNFEYHSLIFTIIMKQILASDRLVLPFFLHIHLLASCKKMEVVFVSGSCLILKQTFS